MAKHEGKADKNIFEITKISEIARRALKKLVSQNRPAIPPYYEKAFYSEAQELGEDQLIAYLLDSLPTGQAATIMVEGVSAMIDHLNNDLRAYSQGLTLHSGELESKHQQIKALVSPDVWKILDKDFLDLLTANQLMKDKLAEAESRLKEQEEQVAKLHQKSRCDPLTGAFNRLAMNEDLPNEFSRTKRYSRTFSMVITDIDHFKKVNDTYGHAVGDEALKAFTKILKKCMRDVDAIYRFGGEEFLIVLPETDKKGAMIAAERLRKMVEINVLQQRKDPSLKLRLTASFGVSSFHKNDSNHDEMLERADKALYLAKKGGRNQVVYD